MAAVVPVQEQFHYLHLQKRIPLLFCKRLHRFAQTHVVEAVRFYLDHHIPQHIHKHLKDDRDR